MAGRMQRLAMRLARAAPLLFLLPALAPFGGAASDEGLVARSIAADQAVVEGSLAGAVWQAEQPPPRLDMAAWSLQAEAADATIERVDRPLTLAAANIDTSALPSEHSQTSASYAGWSATFRQVAPDARVLLLPLQGAQASASVSGPQSVDAAVGAAGQHARRAGPGAPFALPGSDAVAVHPGAAASQSFAGDLLVVVTGFELAYRADGEAGTIDLRTRREPVDPAGAAVRVSAFEAILVLKGAVVAVPTGIVHLVRPTMAAEGDLSLAEVTGRLSLDGGSFRLDRQSATIAGHAEGALDRRDRDLGLDLDVHASHLAIDGRAVPLADAGWAPSGWLWAGLVAFAGVTHVLLGRQAFRGIDSALASRRYADALALVRHLRLHPWHRQDATLVAALSLTELGRAEEARRRLVARAWSPRRQPTRDFLLARALARLGDRTETLRWLAASLLADPALLAQAKADPALAPILQQWTPRDERAGGDEDADRADRAAAAAMTGAYA